jgi:hypothetical protein
MGQPKSGKKTKSRRRESDSCSNGSHRRQTVETPRSVFSWVSWLVHEIPRKEKRCRTETALLSARMLGQVSPQWPRGKQRLDACPTTQKQRPRFPVPHLSLVVRRGSKTTLATRKLPISPSYPIYRKIAPRHLFGNSAISQTLMNHPQIETALPVVWAIRLKLFRTPSLGEPSDMGIRRCQFGSERVGRTRVALVNS